LLLSFLPLEHPSLVTKNKGVFQTSASCPIEGKGDLVIAGGMKNFVITELSGTNPSIPFFQPSNLPIF
jgi:hypothetical protein